MIGINDFVTNVEITVGSDHEGTPMSTKRKGNDTLSFYPKPGHKGNLEAAARGLRVDPPDFRPRIKLKANDIGRLTFNDRPALGLCAYQREEAVFGLRPACATI
jgi:hypothetical protein